jgi:serine/threonine-protein kinase
MLSSRRRDVNGFSSSRFNTAKMTDQKKVLGPYTILGLLGRGGMGTVYRAVHSELGREIALKVLPDPEMGRKDATLARRFVREAAICARLSHPNIVRVFDYGQEQDCLYYAMELLEGRSLQDVLEEKPVQPVAVVLRLARDVAQAFACYFPQGIVHRDLKPANIMIDDSGRATLTDFGLVKDLMASGITRQGAIVGTPAYIAPELVRGQPVTPAVDVWSLGVVLFRMLTGKLPFEGGTPSEMLLAIAKKEPASLLALNPQVPVPLESLVMNCLEKDPTRRYGTAEELLADLELATRRAPVARRSAPAAEPPALQPPAREGAAPPVAEVDTLARSRKARASAHLAGTKPAPTPAPKATAPPAPAGPGKRAAAGASACLLLAAGAWGLLSPGNPPGAPPSSAAAPARSALAASAPVTAPAEAVQATTAPAAGFSVETLGFALQSYDPAGRIRRLGERLHTSSPTQKEAVLDAEASVARGSLLASCLAKAGETPGPPLLEPGLAWSERSRQAGWLLDLLLHDLGHRAWNRPGPLGSLEALAGVCRLESRVGHPHRNLGDAGIPSLMAGLFPPPARLVPLVVTTANSDTWDYENARWTKRDTLGGLFETEDKVRSREECAPFELPAGKEVRFAAMMQDFDPQAVFLLHLQPAGSPTPMVLPLASLERPASHDAWYLVTARLAPGALPPGQYRGWLTAHRIFGFSVTRPNLRVLYLALPGA